MRATPPIARVYERLNVVGDEGSCWLWPGAKAHGYGQVYGGGRMLRVHIVVYEAEVGPVPDGLELDHLCRVRACARPSHLEAVTHVENMRRSASRGGVLAAPVIPLTECKRGHPFDEVNTYKRPDGSRQCRTCHAAANVRYRTRSRELEDV